MMTRAQLAASKRQAQETADRYIARPGSQDAKAERDRAVEAERTRRALIVAVRNVERNLPKDDRLAHVRASFDLIKQTLNC